MSIDKEDITSPNVENQKMIIEDLDQADEGQQLKQAFSKDDKGNEYNTLSIDNQTQDLKKNNSDMTNQGMASTSKLSSDKRLSEDRVQQNIISTQRPSHSNKGSNSARGSHKSDLLLDKFKTRLSKNSVNYFGSYRGLESNKEITSVNGEDQAIFAYSKGPTRYKLKKGETTAEGTTSEYLFMQKIHKRMMYFYNNFTFKGKAKFYEKASVHRTLNDKSDGYFDKKSRLPFSWLFSKLQKKLVIVYKNSFISKIPVMSQQSYLSLVLQFLLILYSSIFFLLLSIILVFPNVLVDEETLIYKITLGIWIFEVFVKLNTSTHLHSNIITSRQKILAQYLKKTVIFDSIAFILLIMLILKGQLTKDLGDGWSIYILAQILTFIRLYNVFADLAEFQQQLCMIMKRYYIVKLVNLIVKLFIIAHVIACLWYLVGKIEIFYMGESITWQDKSIAYDQTWWKIYLLSMNWSLTLMTTSQSDGTTVLQIFFSTVIILFTTIISGYMINATGQILVEIDASEDNKRNDLNIINDYMRVKHISTNLQRRVNVYLDYYYQKNYQKKSEDTKNVLQKISSELRSSMQKEYFFQILSKIDFLKYNYTATSLQNIAVYCEEVVYYPNQIIFEQNDYSDAALLIIIEGQVEIYQQVNANEQKIITTLKQGNILGQINFFTGMARTACARSAGFTKLAKISRDNFIQVINNNDKDMQTFYQMKDNILLNENYQEMNIKCSACQSFNHLQGTCSQVHFNKEFAMQSSKVSNQITQRRNANQLSRENFKKYRTLKQLTETQEKNYQFQQFAFLESDIYTQTLNEEDNEDEDNSSVSSQQQLIKIQSQLKQIVEQEEEEDRASNHQTITQKLQKDPAGANTPVTSIQLSQQGEDSTSRNGRRLLSNKFKQQNSSQFISIEEQNQQNENTKNNQIGGNQKQSKIQSNQILPEETLIQTKAEFNKSTFSQSRYQSNHQANRSKPFMNIRDMNKDSNKYQSPEKSPEGKGDDSFDFVNEHFHTQGSLNADLMTNSAQLNNSNNLGNGKEKNNQKYSSKDSFYWSFDRQKDYEYYFNHGNAFIKLHQYRIYQKQKQQKQYIAGSLLKLMQSRKSKGSRGASFLVSKVNMLQNLNMMLGKKSIVQ